MDSAEKNCLAQQSKPILILFFSVLGTSHSLHKVLKQHCRLFHNASNQIFKATKLSFLFDKSKQFNFQPNFEQSTALAVNSFDFLDNLRPESTDCILFHCHSFYFPFLFFPLIFQPTAYNMRSGYILHQNYQNNFPLLNKF